MISLHITYSITRHYSIYIIYCRLQTWWFRGISKL